MTLKSGISGGNIPKAAEKRVNKDGTDVTKAHSQGLHAVDAYEPETRGALDSGIHNTARPKRKEVEKHIYVHLSEDHSDPELISQKPRYVSQCPPTFDHIDKVSLIESSYLNTPH